MVKTRKVGVPSDSLPAANGNMAFNSSNNNSSPPISENNSDNDENDENEFQITEVTSNESEEELIFKDESSVHLEPEEIIDTESSQSNSPQEKSISIKSTFSVSDITPDDEIYTLQFPRSYDNTNLCNINIDFSNLNASITSKGNFKVELLDPDKKFITLAVPKANSSGSLLKLPLKGHIVIQKFVNLDVEPMAEDDCDKDTVVFPNNIKVRHPLLGTDWKAHTELACAAFARSSQSKKNKVRKREKIECKKILDVDEVKSENIKWESEQEFVSPKKKVKRKL